MKNRVLAVCLTKDRPEMVARAVRCFRAQTYENKRMLVWDSSTGLTMCDQLENEGVVHVPAEPQSIGMLRNSANGFWTEFEIICHWDDDDYSHPRRIEEQVATLEASGKETTGYNEMLFWKTEHKWVGCRAGGDPANAGSYEYVRYCDICGIEDTCDDPLPPCEGEAWLYRQPRPGYALGTSLMYWCRAWEHNPFPDQSNGEDFEFLKHVSCKSETSWPRNELTSIEPRMIATVHGGNTATIIDPSRHSEWRRVPDWDARVRAILGAA